ncbi:MAG: hypothetical protein Q9220_004218 [cf. Caloplaca sp. 1 TL-2023]
MEMKDRALLRYIALLLVLIKSSRQVDITITATGSILTGNAIALSSSGITPPNARTLVIATCLDIPAGQCCQAPTHLAPLGSSVNFRHLHALDIAAVWNTRTVGDDYRIRAIVSACSGTVMASQPGPGEWSWQGPSDVLVDWGRRASGASYITMPANLPPDQSTSKWLASEGLLALVWGGGKWFADSAAQKAFGKRSNTSSLEGVKVRRRGIRSEVGKVVARPPMMGRYPTLVEIDGKRYSDGGAGDLMYVDDAGLVFNLTSWFLP